MFSLRLLGSMQIELDGQTLVVSRRKSRALLSYLAVQPTPIRRHQLLGLLWPDHEQASALHTLRSTLYHLRQLLGNAVQSDHDALSLTSDTEVDVRLFETELATPMTVPQRYAKALDLYRGDFLLDLDLPDEPAFEAWVTTERERYRRMAVQGLVSLGQWHEGQGNVRMALETLDRALSLDPLQEDLQRSCLRLHYLAGDRAGAIRRFESLRTLLIDEMGVPPMAETQAMYDAIITDRLADIGVAPVATLPASVSATEPAIRPQVIRPAIARSAHTLPFIGRSTELATLQAGYPFPKLVLIEGEAGIGKSRLIEMFLTTIQHTGMGQERAVLSLVGQGRELEQGLPYQPIIEALRDLLIQPDWAHLKAGLQIPEVWLAEIARLLPDLADSVQGWLPSPRTADESRLWKGIAQFILAVARQRPIILVVDDLHWANASTLGLLGYLIREAAVAAAPVSFLAATRPLLPHSPQNTLFHALRREDLLQHLILQPLAADAVVGLARQVSSNFVHPLANWLNRGSEGNAFFLTELVAYAREKRILAADGIVNLNALPSSPVVPQTVYTLIQTRMAALSEPARRVLDTASVIGSEFDIEVVLQATGLTDDAALDALDHLHAARLIRVMDERHYAFDHTLTYEVARQEVSKPRLRLLHRRVAETLERTHRSQLQTVAGSLAHHFAAAGLPERSAEYAFRAGKRAAELAAWHEAIALFEEARDAASPAQRLPIHLALGNAYLQAGAFAQAAEDLQETLVRAQTAGDEEIINMAFQFLAESWLMQDRPQQVIALSREMVQTAHAITALTAQALWGVALSVEGTDLTSAAEHLRAAAGRLESPSSEADPALLAQVRFELGNVYAKQGDLRQAIAFYQAALDAASATDAESALRWQILAYNNLGYHLHLLGDPQAQAAVDRGIALAEENGALTLMPYLRSTLGEIALSAEALDTAEDHFREALDLARRFSQPERVVGLTANLGQVAARRGQTDRAIQLLSTALREAETLPNRYLTAQIHLGLASLLPSYEACDHLVNARALIETGGYSQLLAELLPLEAQTSSASCPSC